MGQGKDIVFVMGVAGSGKTLIGKMLSEEWSIPFFDADNFHSEKNKRKMSDGIPLNDKDRYPWLYALNRHAKQHTTHGCIIACSALKEKYRTVLSKDIGQNTQWIYLHGTYEILFDRLQNRKNHYMSAEMLESQLADLEEPIEAIRIDVTREPKTIVKDIKRLIK